MLADSLLRLTLELCRRVIGTRVLDSLPSQIDRDFGLRPTHALDRMWRNEHAPTAPPVARGDNQVGNRPRVIVNEQILHVADVTIRRFDMMANDRVVTAKWQSSGVPVV